MVVAENCFSHLFKVTNNDGVEDVIVVVHDYLDGGNYMNSRLLVLSVDTKDNWQLIKML